MPTTLNAPKKQLKTQKALRAAHSVRKGDARAPLPSADQFLLRLKNSGWWNTLTPAQKKLASSVFPEASGMLRPRIWRRKGTESAG
jgi:hypothetical protein